MIKAVAFQNKKTQKLSYCIDGSEQKDHYLLIKLLQNDGYFSPFCYHWGFINEKNEFLTREKAYKEAFNSNQIITSDRNEILFSNNVRWL